MASFRQVGLRFVSSAESGSRTHIDGCGAIGYRHSTHVNDPPLSMMDFPEVTMDAAFRSLLAVALAALAVGLAPARSFAEPQDEEDRAKQEIARIKALGAEHQPELAAAFVKLSDVYLKEEKIKEAEIVLEQALLIETQITGVKASTLDRLFENLGAVKAAQGNVPQALAYLDRVLKLRERTYGVDDPKVAETLTKMAELSPDSALRKRALEIHLKSTTAKADRLPLVKELLELASSTSDKAEADALRRRALELQESILGPDHPDLVPTIMAIVNQRMSVSTGFNFSFTVPLGESDLFGGPELYKKFKAEAIQLFPPREKLLRRAVAILEKAGKSDAPEAVGPLSYLAAGYLAQDDDARALPYMRRALAIREKAEGAENPELLDALQVLTRSLMKLQKYQEAVPILQRVVPMQEAVDAKKEQGLVLKLSPIPAFGDMQDEPDDENDFKALLRRAIRLSQLEKDPGLRPDEADLAFLKGIGCVPATATVQDLLETRTLEIPGARIDDESMRHLRGLVNLRTLAFKIVRGVPSASKISDAGLGYLGSLKGLRRLRLSGTEIRGPGLASLQGMDELRELHLAKTPLDDAGLAHLPALPSLEYLDLMGTELSDASIPALKRLLGLRNLNVARTKISKAGAEDLQRAMPDLHLFHESRFAQPH